MNKLKSFFVSLKLRLSDLFLLIGFAPMVVFLICGQLFMRYSDPDDVPLKISLAIPLFVLLISSWSIYLYLEHKRGNKVNIYINCLFIFLLVIGIIGIAIQPSDFVIDMIKYDGELETIGLIISPTHYIFFSMYLTSLILFIYISLFVFPKRFNNFSFIRFAGYFVFLLCAVLIIASYILEADNYIPFIEAAFKGEYHVMNWYAAKSIIIHKNAYGMVLLLGIIFCLINHSLEKKWIYFPAIIFFYLNMIFTLCRTSLLLAPVISLIYFYYTLITGLNTHKKAKIITLITISSVIVLLFFVVAVSYLSKGSFVSPLYNVLSALFNNESIDSREWIWGNVYQLVSQKMPLSLLFGRGFGLMNEMLLPMNIANEDSPLSFPTHNGFLNLFAEGGLPYLFAYLLLLGYVFVIAFRSFKNNPSASLAIALGLLSFVFYSLIETIHYLTYIFMFVLFTFYNTQLKNIEE